MGNTILVRLLHSAKAYFSYFFVRVEASGNLILVSAVHLLNTPSPICSKLLGNTTGKIATS